MASLAKLTSQSTQTLSLLLERQRLSTLSSGSNTLHSTQITRNLNQLRNGILDLEEKEGPSEAVRLLKSQFERMRGMLGEEADIAGVQSLAQPVSRDASPAASSSSLTPLRSDSPTPPHPPSPPPKATSGPFAPYTDDPEAGYGVPEPASNENILQTQRQLMDEQDVHLDRLSHSINRQRDLSLQINDELEVHTGLLEGLDRDLDGTGERMRSARRRLDRVAKGAKENSSTVIIGIIILILLILIIIFKT
ncbi:hypothetical protein NLI96_g7542 [Meripilus lineatus]|uniref:t-SNARE coiled-coil homology domain-containing protein n=1 Tax=Meripilus lineatus TaxID=2056292 RepID=A0AAD5UYW1_9APHY|nr:hypothetical protein NLI96_g7542 [Physisporinus lineatus]